VKPKEMAEKVTPLPAMAFTNNITGHDNHGGDSCDISRQIIAALERNLTETVKQAAATN